MSILFSFVVPACNTALYAEELVASLKAQTITDFEALIVSEESSDGTREALRKAVGNDTRFLIVELPRSGSASVSRNYGIQHAKGEYLVFVDGDDWVDPESLARFKEAVEKFGRPDIILADWIFHETRPGGDFVRTERCHWVSPNRLFDGPDVLKQNLKSDFHTGSPLYICKRQFLADNALLQIPGRRMEDDEWAPRILFVARSVVYLNFAFYHYRKRSHSVTTDTNGRNVTNFTDNFFSFLKFSASHEISPGLYRVWAKWETRLCNMYFAPSMCRRYPREVREREFKRLAGSSSAFRCFCAVNRRAGWSRRILNPVYAVARLPGCFRFGEDFYRWIYWPLVFHIWGTLKKYLLKWRR